MPADSSVQEPEQVQAEAGPLLSSEEDARTAAAAHPSRGHRVAGVAVALGLALLAIVGLTSHLANGHSRAKRRQDRVLDTGGVANNVEHKRASRSTKFSAGAAGAHAEAPPAPKPAANCVWDGDDCTQSRCCLDGGDRGFQCFQRDETLAKCTASCEPGEHEEDETNGYDASGNPTKPKWSCKELGVRSQPGCHVFRNKTDCPTDRCQWKLGKCALPCSSFNDAKTCDAKDECMWNEDSCHDTCWMYGKQKQCLDGDHKKRCVWDGEKCRPGCWMFRDQDSCSTGGMCVWDHLSGCGDDPCSAPGEDCSETKCCSGYRGGAGMTCYKKDKYFSTCSKSCAQEKGWECSALGNRTKTQTHCSWAGEDCSKTGMCCNTGFQCYKKDHYFSGCVQTYKMKVELDKKGNPNLKKVKVPMPEGWPEDAEFIGGGQEEYQMPMAAEGEALGTTLYCALAYLPGSYEEKLMELARANSASVFACDGYDLFKTWQSANVGWSSGETTLQNTDVFVSVWEEIKKAGNLWSYEWTVKVDPDALLVPQRLKWHLEALKAPKNSPIYVKNNDLGAGQGNNGFLGAVEVFSREAMELYYDWWPKCLETLGTSSGEDGFMKGCMDAMGVGFVLDGGMFKPDDNVAICKQGKWAAYHPLKDQKEYQCCIDIVYFGVNHEDSYGKCTDMAADWAQKTWPGAGPEGVEPRWRKPN